jgi:hypothetical protein
MIAYCYVNQEILKLRRRVMKVMIRELRIVILVALVCGAGATAARSQDKPQIDRDAYAARGATLADQDPLASQLRNSFLSENSRNGFNIGMAVAEEHTAPGPGKDAKCASLLRDEPEGCSLAVLFSVERNRNAALAAKGVAIAEADQAFANARKEASSKMRPRTRAQIVFFLLGFDIGLGASDRQTLPGPGKDKIRDELLHPFEKAGFNQAVSFALEHNRRIAGESSSGTTDGPADGAASGTTDDSAGGATSSTTDGPSSDKVASSEIRCRGFSKPGGGNFVFFTINSRPSSTGETLVTYEIAFSPSWRAAGARGEGLDPGTCAYADRPIAASGPYRIRFETVANAQLKQALHGSPVDNSSTAAESYPDVNTIPVYLKGDNHYWSFGGITDSRQGHFVAGGNGYWKPSVAINNVPGGSPTAPAGKHLYPAKP